MKGFIYMELDKTLKMTIITLKILGIDGFSPVVSEITQWTGWHTNFKPFTCEYCAKMHGNVFHKTRHTLCRGKYILIAIAHSLCYYV